MKNVLYIGNNLNNKKTNLSSIKVLGPLLEKEGYCIQYSSSKRNKLFRLVDMLFSCVKYRRQVDVVLIDTYSTLNFYYAYFVSQLCRTFNLKYIPILHGGNLSKRLKQNPKLSSTIFKNSYKNISPSLYLVHVFKSFGYTNVDYIPNAIEIENYKFQEKEFQNVNLLWVRSFSKIYNPSLAISVLESLKNKKIQATLCMVGPEVDGTMNETQMLAKNLKLDVRFTGKLTKPEWIELSKDYNIFINTTNFDNMPVSVIEAMALGLVVVSTNVGGLPYLIDHKIDGILVAPNDKDRFSESISELTKSPEKYKSLALNARHKAEQFNWSVIKHHWIKTLQ